jgi:type I restriction enzyme R subunit
MMDTSEYAFETHIVKYLTDTHNYRQRDSKAHYDRALALDWDLTLEFITSTQTDTWKDLERQHGSQTVEKFKRRLVREIERRGTVDVLRRGVKDSGCYFQLAYFKPSTSLNPEHLELYGKNIFSVIRQCRYSQVESRDAIDLVLFLNGLPIFTVELKNHLTGQTVEHAKKQYQNDRSPKNEPLLEFGRCLAHFAVER